MLTTRRHAEGTAMGFNRKRKGARSYYPLFCTVAQTSQFLDLHHRPGNVHDSNGALELVRGSAAAGRPRTSLRWATALASQSVVARCSSQPQC